MAQKWNVSGFPQADTSQNWDVFGAYLVNGIVTALSEYSGPSDPSTGAPVAWGSAEVGRRWLDTGVDGSAADPVQKQWVQLTAVPTYGWRRLRGVKQKMLTTPQAVTFSPASPAAADVAFTDVDLSSLLDGAGVQDSGDTARLVIGVWLRIRVATGASETVPAGSDNCYFAVRTNGGTNELKVYPQVQNRYAEALVFVPLDAGEIFEFAVDVGGGTPSFEYAAWVVGIVEAL